MTTLVAADVSSESPLVASSDCWHCSLLSYSVSYTSPSYMDNFSTYFLPGAIFLTLSIRWGVHMCWRWSQAAAARDLETAGLPPPPASCSSLYLRSLPWEGIVKLVLTGLGIIVSVAMSPRQHGQEQGFVTDIRLVSIYLFFSLSGLVDILVFYCGYTLLPEGLQSFILSLAFSAEALMFGSTVRDEPPVEQQVHLLLVAAVVANAFSACMEVVFDNRLVKFCRAYFCFVQGSWLVHGGFLIGPDTGSVTREWVTILFTWHIAGAFILSISCLLFTSFLSRRFAGPKAAAARVTTPPRSSRESVTPPSTHTHSTPTSSADLSFQQKHLPVLPGQFFNTGLSVLPQDKDRSSGHSPSVVEAEPCDQVSQSEEYHTLSRQLDHHRASIKLKESSLI